MKGIGRTMRRRRSGGALGRTAAGFSVLSLGLAAAAAARPLLRHWIQQVVKGFAERILREPYAENLWELLSASRAPGAQVLVETNLRAREGAAIQRPLGSPRPWPDFSGLVFDFAQLERRPTNHDAPVDLSVVLGPRARRPLRVDIPILISGMAYGLALSARAKVALARGASLAGTASNTGEGPIHPMERQAAHKLIVQFHRGTWGKDPEVLRRAAMVEIHLGQGAAGGVGNIIRAARDNRALREQLGVRPGQDAITYSIHPELRGGRPLKDLVDELRQLTEGAPIGIKLAPGRQLEKDLARALEAGVDVIALDGAQAATKGSAPILQDDFGVPTLHALIRAERFLQSSGRRRDVSLIVGGGLFTPGDFLKAIALGADAVYIGRMALFALSHGQLFKSLPWEPPTQLVFFGGAQEERLDVDEAAHRLASFLRSCAEEMAIAIRALGKTSLREVSAQDLMALDPHTAEICGVTPTYRAPEPSAASGHNGAPLARSSR